MTVFCGFGDLIKITEILKSYNVRRVLAVTGKKSFHESGGKVILDDCLKDYSVTFFSDFEVNPKLLDAQRGVELAKENDVEALVCIGGGSVLDMGKLIKALYSNSTQAVRLATGDIKVIDPNLPLVAIPTTAGSGSESTHFAVVYVEGKKYSLADACLIPNDIILDGALVLSATRYQKACNVLDALSQSIESAWAVGASDRSREISFLALKMCIANFDRYVNCETDILAAQGMIEASNLAGQAINISKTTAAHAWSYGFTTHFGTPHGHAVWLTLPAIFEIHARAMKDDMRSNMDLALLRAVIEKLMHILGIVDVESIAPFFDRLLRSIGIDGDINMVVAPSDNVRMELSTLVNVERLKNNPIKFSPEDVSVIFKMRTSIA